jgi:hypothetical protein
LVTESKLATSLLIALSISITSLKTLKLICGHSNFRVIVKPLKMKLYLSKA